MTYISMVINLQGESLPNPDELDLRWEIRDLIEDRKIGEVIGSGGGGGQMDIGIEVTDTDAAKSQLRAIANEYGLQNVEFNVHPDSEIED